MVTRTLRGRTFGLALLLTGAFIPVRADGILEQMQNDVAAIVRNNKGGIVSIEDEGAAPNHRFGDGNAFPSGHLLVAALPGEKQATEQRIGELKKKAQGRRGNQPQDHPGIPKSGSGFSIGNGYIVTTADVVEDMQRPLVITDDGTRIRAKLVGIDAEMNLGLLKLPERANLPALKMGDSDTAAAGHFAISIGNQAGRNNSVALTMIAGFRTEGTFTGQRFYPALIQIAGTVGAGTSGAPILNARGEVIGVIAGVPAGEWTETQFLADPQQFLPNPGIRVKPFPPEAPPARSPQPEPFAQAPGNPFVFGQGQQPSGAEQNPPPMTRLFLRPPVTSAGYAIPINDLQFSIKELMATGKIAHIWLGVDLKNERKVDEQDGIIKIAHFVSVRGVYPDSPAQKAGIQPGDILVNINGKSLTSTVSMRKATMRLHPTDKIPITISRNGTTQLLQVTVETRPEKITPPSPRSR